MLSGINDDDIGDSVNYNGNNSNISLKLLKQNLHSTENPR